MHQPDGKRILVIDDDPLFLDYLGTLLSHNGDFRVIQVADAYDVFAKLREDPHIACVVLDYDLGAESGLTLGKAIKDRFADPPPIVMLTGRGSEITAVKAFRIGFADYVSKQNLDQSELFRAIRGAIARREEDQSRKAETDKLRINARIDDLTGLHAASYIQARLSELRFRGSQNGFSLFVVRPKQLDQIRQELGYVVAEKLLRSFANLLKEATTGAALCGHISTEEFVCVYEARTSPELVRNTCEHLARALQLTEEQSRMQLRIEPLIGAAVFPDDGDTAQKVLEAAISALVKADKLGLQFGSTILPMERSLEQPLDVVAVTALNEQRKAPRKRVLKRGKIIVEALGWVLDCTVRDLSEAGAHLRTDSYFPVPERFKLQIVGSGSAREVEKRWQAGTDFGVEFCE